MLSSGAVSLPVEAEWARPSRNFRQAGLICGGGAGDRVILAQGPQTPAPPEPAASESPAIQHKVTTSLCALAIGAIGAIGAS